MKRSLPSEQAQPPPPSKTRRFKHVDGNWPCHICLSFGPELHDGLDSGSDDDDDNESDTMAESIEALAASTSHLLPSSRIFPSQRPLHISLCHTFVLQHHQIKPFLQALKKELSTCLEYQLVLTNAIVQFTNQNNTRRFYALPADGGTTATRTLIEHVNRVLVRMGQPTYHEHPSIHVSIGWSPLNGAKEQVSGKQNDEGVGKDHTGLNVDLDNGVVSDTKNSNCLVASSTATLEVAFRVTKVTCKIGNKIETIPLIKVEQGP
jgi:hypothetical protein